jgi:Ca2+-binding EF-hand superfamily protein
MLKPIHLAPTMLAAVCFATIGCQTTASHSTTPDHFAQADANHDGKLSRDEINAYTVTKVFESRDMNHDGRLTKAEWLVGEDAGQEKLFRERDANHDDAVTRDEALAYGRKKGAANKVLRQADKNKDGGVSREEMTAFYGSKEGEPY